jgi:hypothetical protein
MFDPIFELVFNHFGDILAIGAINWAIKAIKFIAAIAH